MVIVAIIICISVDGFRSFKYATNARVASRQSFFALVVLRLKLSHSRQGNPMPKALEVEPPKTDTRLALPAAPRSRRFPGR